MQGKRTMNPEKQKPAKGGDWNSQKRRETAPLPQARGR